MKQFFILSLLCFFSVKGVLSQTYRVQWTWSNISRDDGGNSERLIISDGTGALNTIVLSTANCPTGTSCPDRSGVKNITFKPTSVYLQTSFSNPTGTQSILYTDGMECDDDIYYLSNQNAQISPVTLKITPNISFSASPSVGSLGVCETISLTANGEFSPDQFVWEYSYDTGGDGPLGPSTSGYKEIPGKSGRRNITVSSSDIPDVPVETVFRIRLRYCPGNNIGTTTAISFDYTKCSPVITHVETFKTTCEYTADGNAQFFFNRPLEDGEVLNGVYLIPLDDENNQVPFIPLDDNITTLDEENSFLWPRRDLAAGLYRLQYQSDTNGTDEISQAFNIEKPQAFSFTITADPILCSNGSTNIEIEASGGTSPYYYQIGTDTPVEFIGNTININAVQTADYELRVFDAKGCFQKLN